MPEEIKSRWLNGEEYLNQANAAKYIGLSGLGLRKLLNRLEGTEQEIVEYQQPGAKERLYKKSELDHYMQPRPVRAKE